jgi:hypothetical protein
MVTVHLSQVPGSAETLRREHGPSILHAFLKYLLNAYVETSVPGAMQAWRCHVNMT